MIDNLPVDSGLREGWSLPILNLSEEEKYQQIAKDVPVQQVIIEAADACNLDCSHCCSSDRLSRGRTTENVLTAHEILSFVEKCTAAGLNAVTVSGGEPLLHPELEKILRGIDEMGVTCSISTNATLVDDDAAKMLVETCKGGIGVSMDGPRKVHDSIRGPGAFRDAWKGISHIQNAIHKSRVSHELLSLKMTVHEANYRTIPETIRGACSRGVHRFIVQHIRMIGNAARYITPISDPENRRWIAEVTKSPQGLVRIDDFVHADEDDSVHFTFPELLPTWRKSGQWIHIEECKPEGLYSCNLLVDTLVRIGFIIAADGEAYYCDGLCRPEYSLGNLRRNTFEELRNSPVLYQLKEMMRQVTERDPACRKCIAKGCGVCGGPCGEAGWDNEPNVGCTFRRTKAVENIARRASTIWSNA